MHTLGEHSSVARRTVACTSVVSKLKAAQQTTPRESRRLQFIKYFSAKQDAAVAASYIHGGSSRSFAFGKDARTDEESEDRVLRVLHRLEQVRLLQDTNESL